MQRWCSSNITWYEEWGIEIVLLIIFIIIIEIDII